MENDQGFAGATSQEVMSFIRVDYQVQIWLVGVGWHVIKSSIFHVLILKCQLAKCRNIKHNRYLLNE